MRGLPVQELQMLRKHLFPDPSLHTIHCHLPILFYTVHISVFLLLCLHEFLIFSSHSNP